MGWTFMPKGWTKVDLIKDLTRDWIDTKEDGSKVKTGCLAKRCVGDELWTVWEKKTLGPGPKFAQATVDRYIILFLLEHSDSWGYKAMDESVHPYFYGCPISYLKKAPHVRNQEWRDEVQAQHERRKPKLSRPAQELRDLLKWQPPRATKPTVVFTKHK
jgi:hypothetical protein